MQLLYSTDLALRTLIRLSAEPDRHLSTEILRVSSRSPPSFSEGGSIADRRGIPRTIRGVKGGVILARPADTIRVGEVVRHQEREQAIAECFREGGNCTLVPCCRLKGVLMGAREAFFRHLDKVTLSDCMTSAKDILALSEPLQKPHDEYRKLQVCSMLCFGVFARATDLPLRDHTIFVSLAVPRRAFFSTPMP